MPLLFVCSQAPSKEIYYFNFISGESIWDHPCDEHFRRVTGRQLQSQGPALVLPFFVEEPRHPGTWTLGALAHCRLCFVVIRRKLYAQEKARLEEHRQQGGAAQQNGQPPHGQQQEHEQAQQQWAGQEPGKQQQQQQLQQAKAPALVVPSSSVVQHTDVEVRLVGCPSRQPVCCASMTLSHTSCCRLHAASLTRWYTAAGPDVTQRHPVHHCQRHHRQCGRVIRRGPGTCCCWRVPIRGRRRAGDSGTRTTRTNHSSCLCGRRREQQRSTAFG